VPQSAPVTDDMVYGDYKERHWADTIIVSGDTVSCEYDAHH